MRTLRKVFGFCAVFLLLFLAACGAPAATESSAEPENYDYAPAATEAAMPLMVEESSANAQESESLNVLVSGIARPAAQHGKPDGSNRRCPCFICRKGTAANPSWCGLWK